MKAKLAITSAAALLAATLFAAAQTQPGGMPNEQPPQGADAGMNQGSSVPPAGGSSGKGTVGSGQTQQGKKKGMSGQADPKPTEGSVDSANPKPDSGPR
jgi:hypothetical protein